MIRISLQDLIKIFAIFAAVTISSCTKNNDEPSFRIVGLNGESREVKTRVPELNARILESQGRPVPQAPAEMSPQQNQSAQQYAPATREVAAEGSSNLHETMQADQGKPFYNVPKNESPASPALAGNAKPDNVSVGAAEDKEQEIQYDLSDSSSEKSAQKSSKKMKLKSGVASKKAASEEVKDVELQQTKKGIFVQTGSFSSKQNADSDLVAVKRFGKTTIEEVDVGDKKIYRVLVGPFPNSKKAKDVVRKIKSTGHDAIIVKNK